MNPIELLAGAWYPVRAELDGEQAPDLVLERLIFTIRVDGRYEVTFDGVASDAGNLNVGGNGPPSELHLHGTQGTNAGKDIPAIYQLQGNRLRICYGLDKTLPAAFNTAPGSARYLVTYRREAWESPTP